MKNTQRGAVGVAILAVLALALVGGGSYAYVTSKKEAEIKTVEDTQDSNADEKNDVPSDSTQVVKADVKVDAKIKAPVEVDVVTIKTPTGTATTTACNGKIAGLKALNAQFMAYLNEFDSYPTTLAKVENYGTVNDYSGRGYLYAYYPSVKPTQYHLGLKLDASDGCAQNTIDSAMASDADFNSKTAGYINGFDGSESLIVDYHDTQNN
jgi:predicted ribosomally synthesized peptide with SipW-like signal peptide